VQQTCCNVTEQLRLWLSKRCMVTCRRVQLTLVSICKWRTTTLFFILLCISLRTGEQFQLTGENIILAVCWLRYLLITAINFDGVVIHCFNRELHGQTSPLYSGATANIVLCFVCCCIRILFGGMRPCKSVGLCGAGVLL
jgi:hypothetical protein